MSRLGRCLIDFHGMLFRLGQQERLFAVVAGNPANTLTTRQVDHRLRSHLAGDFNLHISVQLAGTGTDFESVSQLTAHLFQRFQLRSGRDLDCTDV